MSDTPEGYSHIDKSSAWQVGAIFSEVPAELFLDPVFQGAKWFDEQIRVSVRPDEHWVDAYVRQFNAQPDTRFLCFTIDAMSVAAVSPVPGEWP